MVSKLNKNIFYHISVLPDRTITMFKFLLGGNSVDSGFVFIDNLPSSIRMM